MRKLHVLLFTLLVGLSAYGANREVSIIDIVSPESIDQDYLVLASDGQIYTIENNNEALLELAHSALEQSLPVKLKLSSKVDTKDLLGLRSEVLGIKLLSESKSKKTEEDFFKDKDFSQDILMSSYVTDIDSEEKLKSYFKSMRRKMRRSSECFNRAYVWSWEMSFNKMKGQRVHMGKTWLFFTRKYIRDYDYKWWFHIAPYLTLNKEVRVMDRSFTRTPVTLQEWTDEFIYSKEECKIVSKYSDYKDHQYERDCFVIKTSVHYWQPSDIKDAEDLGTAQTDWSSSRLKKAYKNAVGIFAKPPERD